MPECRQLVCGSKDEDIFTFPDNSKLSIKELREKLVVRLVSNPETYLNQVLHFGNTRSPNKEVMIGTEIAQ